MRKPFSKFHVISKSPVGWITILSKDKKAYLSNLYEELYVKDIVERNKLEREDILNAILDFIASQIGSLTNPTNIANALTSMRHEPVNNKIGRASCRERV